MVPLKYLSIRLWLLEECPPLINTPWFMDHPGWRCTRATRVYFHSPRSSLWDWMVLHGQRASMNSTSVFHDVPVQIVHIHVVEVLHMFFWLLQTFILPEMRWQHVLKGRQSKRVGWVQLYRLSQVVAPVPLWWPLVTCDTVLTDLLTSLDQPFPMAQWLVSSWCHDEDLTHDYMTSGHPFSADGIESTSFNTTQFYQNCGWCP